MKNYYNILNVSKDSSNEQIKEKTKKLVTDLKLAKIYKNEKDKKLKELEEAYTFLTDYHKRRSLDEFLENRSINLNASNPFNMFDSIFNKTTFPIDNVNSKSFFKSSSYSTKMNKDGNLVTEEKVLINDNGKKSESHKLITKDKDGNEIIKDITSKNKKKKIKYNI